MPDALRTGPFTSADANVVGVTRDQLRRLRYCRLGAGVYCWVGLKETPLLMLTAVARRLPDGAAFSAAPHFGFMDWTQRPAIQSRSPSRNRLALAGLPAQPFAA
ncbi:MAG: hypothetical protein PVSMB3_06540 [Candidatus Dormibacteraceae bacterium]